MSLDIVIRPERADHPQVVVALAALDDYLGSIYPPEANHILPIQALLAPDVSFFAAWQGGQVVGTAALRRAEPELATGHTAYGEVKRMYVAPALRGQRVGRRLLATLEEAMQAQGLTLSLLETGADQHEAVRLYQRHGYHRRGPFGGYPDNGLSLFMAKPLQT